VIQTAIFPQKCMPILRGLWIYHSSLKFIYGLAIHLLILQPKKVYPF